ncbi:amidase [Balneola vulgaris]|uniref:amidase n=1 Tax=Balneola vulgaris TaxID=287535 RepID=UPI000477F58C|nr:amidase [Balneola vulgaris]
MKHTFYTLFLLAMAGIVACSVNQNSDDEISIGAVQEAASIIGLDFTEAEIDTMLDALATNRNRIQQIREMDLDYSVPPSLVFNPVPVGKTFETQQKRINWDIPSNVQLPANKDDLAFYTVAELSTLIKSKKISSVELTEFFIARIEKYNNQLEAIVTVTKERALEQARQMDQELANGKYRGPLHGIPYGLKDLFSVEDYKTTWGATPYKDQMIDETASVVSKLDEAGAVLIAKTTLGALARGDVWFGGKTKKPWDLEQGSSGSSAGSASGTSAGLFPFAIGTETLGSIISPSTRNGVSGLRPTYGRVSRTGAMALSWTMDKVGPIARSVEDLALVFDAIYGPDGIDQTLIDLPFNYESRAQIKGMKIGYLKESFERDYSNKERDQAVLETLKELGAELVPIELPDVNGYALRGILYAEAAASFNDLTLSNRDDLLKGQSKGSWPNTFRSARFIPAVEYINATRARYLLIQEMNKVVSEVDVYVTPTFGNSNLVITNLTGHPAVVVPNGFTDNNRPTSITFTGDLYDEATVLKVAKAYQQATDHHLKHPPLFSNQ